MYKARYKASTTNMLGGVQLLLSAISGIARFWFKLCMHTLKTSHHWLRALNHKVPCLFKTKTLAAIIILLIENKKQAHSILLNVPCCAAIHFKRSSIPPLNMYQKLHHMKY